jgi:quercetin dioxygenase-like cupin family protein
MKTGLSQLILILLFAGSLSSVAQDGGEIDAVAVSPDIFSVILENEQVRVIEYTLAPGQRDNWHTHPPKVSYVLAQGTLRITTADGASFLTEEKPGEATWMNSLGRHYAENVGTTSVRILLVEVKTAE